ncbi:MAG: hypothetical protein AVDCRST_MAG61-1909 [uncultured Friedmanniella sp.]|uniref:Low molecular weight protein antigen 6 PH domain-containing protein n=1 Tax=uncultured Friedmanniella sp. TaxID=335381 RepID=A0A6J4KRS2_9ACTN|nr:PH domain-containing protein [uncultured Friedmanniella sp.]CAA9313712.1 MAG: hypothetical protein AVDCRST_MAG61-1909 [uncultured Friedmanniella sp.]
MSVHPVDRPPVQRFTLQPRPPVRALAIAAVSDLVGALLLVGWGALDLPIAVAVVGALALAFGTVLVGAALVLNGRLRTQVQLAAEAITVVRGGRQRSVPWSAVEEVKLQHPQLHVVATDPADGLVIVNPRAAGDPLFASMMDAIRQRLDTDRGYRPLE